MNIRIEETKEFSKDFEKLKKKYISLEEDLAIVEKIISKFPTGKNKEGTRIIRIDPIMGFSEQVFKVRVRCRSLKSSDRIRLIYFYNIEKNEIFFIDIYFKGNKAIEDKKRIKNFLKFEID